MFSFLAYDLANYVHRDNADTDQYRQDDGHFIKNSIAGAVFILAEVAIRIGAAGQRAQTLRLALLDGYAYDDGYSQDQNSRTKDI